MAEFILAVDQGTTSSRAIVFDGGYRVRGVAQQEFPQHFPRSGWVEHDPEDIWRTVLATMRGALADAKLSASDIAAIGITNQRETTLIWDRKTGQAIHNAIVWQDRRTADACEELRREGVEAHGHGQDRVFCWMPISPPPRRPGFWIMSKARARRRSAANWPSAPWTRFCCGGSRAARCTPPISPTPRVRCFAISTAAIGTTIC